MVTFSGEFRTRGTAEKTAAGFAGLFLRVLSGHESRNSVIGRADVNDPSNNIVMIPGERDWTGHHVTVRVPDDSNIVVFGVFLAGHGRIEMRNPQLTRGS